MAQKESIQLPRPANLHSENGRPSLIQRKTNCQAGPPSGRTQRRAWKRL